MKRWVSFDYIRAVSIIGIVLCHCCYGISGMSFLGRFLGLTFNVVFLTLSAFLLGLSWVKKGRKNYDASFLIHRISKLAYAYYPFVVLMFVFLACVGYHTSVKDWIMHLLFLPWFDKLPGFGHLWFVTMIVICYVGVFLISQLPYKIVNKCEWGGVIVAIASQVVLGKVGLPSYIFLYLALYLLVFLNARKILSFVDRIRVMPIALIACIVVPVVIYLFYLGLMNEYTSVWGGLISAFVLFSMLYVMFKEGKERKIINFISSISFEIYLVHHVFCFGRFSLFKVVENPILGIIAILLLSVLLAYPLHLIGNGISALVDKKGNK